MNMQLLHHWLVSMRGGEKVLEQFCRLFPGAPVHTLVYNEAGGAVSQTIRRHTIRPSLLNSLPGAARHYPSMLPLFPMAIRKHRIKGDFVLSSDASLIKGMNIDNEVPHVCYCHSPPRYLWDLQEQYLASMGALKRRMFKKMTPRLCQFDQQSAAQVDRFIANSQFVKERIRRIYGREATVIHPPVDLQAFTPGHRYDDFYLIVSALTPYKKAGLAIRAFNKMGKELRVIGAGSERKKLQTMAGSSVTIMGSQPHALVRRYFSRCKALIFPGVEDFGITPLEAQASGRPVIAFRGGGARETVVEGQTGLFFEKQTVEALTDAVERFEKNQSRFTPEACRTQAEKFGSERFRRQIKKFLTAHYPSYFLHFEWGC